MQIDWFTVVAEIVNFLILVALLKYLLYDRIVRVAKEREETIGAELAEAEAQKQAATAAAEAQKQARAALDQQRDALLAAAQAQADARREELIAEAKADVDAQRMQWRSELQREEARFLNGLRSQAGEQVCAIARRALADLADAGLEGQVVAVFMQRLSDLGAAESSALRAALAAESAVVATAFELPPEARDTIASTLKARFGSAGPLAFAVDESLVCGIALRAGDREVTWSVDSYLSHVETSLRTLLEAELAAARNAPGASAGAGAPSAPAVPAHEGSEATERSKSATDAQTGPAQSSKEPPSGPLPSGSSPSGPSPSGPSLQAPDTRPAGATAPPH